MFIATAALLSILTITPASAALVSHSVEFNVASGTRGDNPTQNFNAAIPFFNATLGTLKQVDIKYNFDLELGISISNRTLNPVSFMLAPNRFSIEGPKFFERFNFNNLITAISIPETAIEAPAGTPRTIGSISLVLPGRASNMFDLERGYARTSRPLSIRNIVLRAQGNVTPFIGSGDKLLEFTAFTDNPLNLPISTGNILNGVSYNASICVLGSVDVTYEYEATVVPIPEALPLFLTGNAGFSFFASRKKHKQKNLS